MGGSHPCLGNDLALPYQTEEFSAWKAESEPRVREAMPVVMAVNEAVKAALERARREKIIGSSLRRFEELTVRMPSEADATEALGQFARLPLRKLFFFEPSSKDVPHISLQVLPRSGLTELEICGCPPASEKPFPMVQKLGIIADMAETFVFDVTATFPNLVHLILRGHRWMYNIDYLQTRTRNEEIWQLQCPKAWQSVSTIWAEDSCCLYALGFPRRLSSLSLPLSLDILDREDNLNVAPVVVSASPRFLELRVFMLPFMDVNNDSFEYCPGNWKLNLGPSIQCMTLLLEDRDAISTREKVIIEMLVSIFTHALPSLRSDYLYELQEGLGRMLPGLPSLTHLLVRFVPNLQPPGRGAVDTDWTYPSSSVHAKNIHETIEKHLHILAIMGTSLRWIGYEVQEWGIQSWNISRSELISVEAVRQLQHTGMNPMSESEIRAVLERKGMNPMSEWATRAVLRKEGMNEFRDVPVLHDW